MSSVVLDKAAWLKAPATQALLAALEAHGEEARAVGGAVRNTLLGLPVSDIDIATTAEPDAVISICETAGFAVHPTGLKHGTVTVVCNGRTFEVTTLRRDAKTYGRHADVAYSRDWELDARRRDFTMNAIYCDRQGVLYDPLDGAEDAKAGRVRFVGDARVRIREDYLRILRYFRFVAQFSPSGPDRETIAACVSEQDGLSRLSGERIRVELFKLLGAPGAVRVVQAMTDCGLLQRLIGGPAHGPAFRNLVRIQSVLALTTDPLLRLCALGIANRDDALRLVNTLRLSRAEATRANAAACGPTTIDAAYDETACKALIYRHGSAFFKDATLLAWAREGQAPEDSARRQQLLLAGDWDVPEMPFRGGDLIALGVPAGEKVGETLRAFEDWWIDAGFPDDGPIARAKLAELAKSAAVN